MGVVEFLEKEQMRQDIPQFKTGDTVKVYVRIVEGQKQRIQAYEGLLSASGKAPAGRPSRSGKYPTGSGSKKPFPFTRPLLSVSNW